MFGRGKDQGGASVAAAPDQSADAAQAAGKVGGKGRPTPSRREAEQRNRRSIVAAPALSPNATKAERKAARAAQREALAAERARTRQALYTGDESGLPARDKGPARRWARDYVDARRNLGEFFLPMALVVLGLSLIRNQAVVLASMVLLYGMVIAVAIDAFLVRRAVTKATVERFGDKAQGAGSYAMMRSLQMRRTRLPRAQVDRGQYPA